MKPFTPGQKLIFSVFLLLSLGCITLGPNDESSPPVEDEGCSNQHLSSREVGENGAEVGTVDDADFRPGDQPCNRIAWHGGGGAQGGSTFHIEPAVRVTRPASGGWDADIIFSVRDPDSGEILNETGVEVFVEDWTESGDQLVFSDRVFISAQDRGKNVVVRATIDFAGRGIEEAAAAFHIIQ